MIKSIYFIVFALFSHLAILNAMEDKTNNQISNATLLLTEKIDNEYDLIEDQSLIPPDPVGLINLGTIIKGAFSAYHQYGTKDMVHYGLAYDKVCAKVVKDLVTDNRYLVNHLKSSPTNLFTLGLGSMAISYLSLIHI